VQATHALMDQSATIERVAQLTRGGGQT